MDIEYHSPVYLVDDQAAICITQPSCCPPLLEQYAVAHAMACSETSARRKKYRYHEF